MAIEGTDWRRGIALAAALTLAACAGPPPPRHFSRPPYGPQPDGPPRDRLFISPMGEPFRGTDPIGTWFAGADRDRDGRVTMAEFLADADRFFTTLDVDRSGEIDPAEIERYETEIAPEIRVGAFRDRSPGTGRPEGRGGRPGGRSAGGGGPPRSGGHGRGGGQPPDGGSADEPIRQGAARFSWLGQPEPVIAADADFNRGVSRDEFRTAAVQRFGLLDAAHEGVLTRAALPPLPSGRALRGRPRPSPDDTPSEQP